MLRRLGHDGGGIASLGATLKDHWRELEADFQHYYRINLRYDMPCLQRLYALVAGLPPGAALWRAQESDQPTEEATRIDTSDPSAIDDLWSSIS